MQKSFTLNVERGRAGLWYITSPDLKAGKLFIAHETLATALHAIPECVASLERAKRDPKRRAGRRSAP